MTWGAAAGGVRGEADRFGVLFALLLIFLAVGNALGPVYAGAIYDEFGSYRWFLWTIIPFMIVMVMFDDLRRMGA